MNFLSRITAALLATTALTAPMAVGARPALQEFDRGSTEALVAFVVDKGVEVFIDDPYCSEGENEGRLMGAASSEGQLLICAENHNGDMAELADTVRHEIVHLAQYCKGKTVGATIATLSPRNSDQWLDHAISVLGMPTDLYEESSWRVEAEARVLAQYLTDQQIAGVYRTFCGPQSLA